MRNWINFKGNLQLLYMFLKDIKEKKDIIVVGDIETSINNEEKLYICIADDKIYVTTKEYYKEIYNKDDKWISCSCGCGGRLCIHDYFME